MKKKFLVGLLALALPLTACEKFWEKTNTENSQEKQGESGENQGGNQEPSRTNLVIEEYVGDIIGRDTFSSDEKAYFVSSALEVDEAKVDVNKIEKYVDGFPLLEDESTAFLDIADYLVSIQKDGGLDDCAYFIAALGKSILFAVNNNQGLQVKNADISALLAVLENEKTKLGENIFGLANTIVDTYSLATKLTFLTACQSLIGDNDKINTSSLKKVLEDGSGILEKFAEIKTNVVYFVDLAKSAVKSVFDVHKKLETDEFSVAMFKVYDKVLGLDIGAAVGYVFDFIKELSAGIKTLDASYYAKINELEDPIEADLYAIFALLEHVGKDFTINFDEVEKGVEAIVDFAKEIYGYIKDQIEDVPEYVETIANSANTELVLNKLAKFIVNLLNIRLDSINPLSLAKICGKLIYFATGVSKRATIHTNSWDEVDERIKNLVEYSDVEYELSNYGSYYFDEKSEIVVVENGNASVTYYILIAHRYVYGEGKEDYYDDFFFDVYTKTLENLDEVGVLIYAVIAEIADSTIPVDLTSDLIDAVSSAIDLYNEIGDGLNFEDDIYSYIELFIKFFKDEPELIKKTVDDLFNLLKNLASAFVNVGEEAEINLTAFVLTVMEEGFDPTLIQVTEEKIEGLIPLLEDAYNILSALGLLEDVLPTVASLGHVEQVEDIYQFTTILYDFISMMFVVEAE